MLQQRDLQLHWMLIDSDSAYAQALETLQCHTGPVAIDTERASGYKYYQKAYLLQLKRGNSPIYLFDPTVIADFSALAQIIADDLWILHSGVHDFPCLAELGLKPKLLWDTELGARILGYNRVGLASLVAECLDVELEKAYSHENWSERPLPEKWLEYAAVDVEFLAPLAAKQQELAHQRGRLTALEQEFAHLCNWQPKPPRAHPWRQISNITTLVRDNRALAIARELWYERDTAAKNRDLAPHLLLTDAAIVLAAESKPRSLSDLQRLDGFRSGLPAAQIHRWWRAILRGKQSTENLQQTNIQETVGYSSTYFRQNKHARARLDIARAAVASVASELHIPVAQLMDVRALKLFAANPPQIFTAENVADSLRRSGAREWQISACADTLTKVFARFLKNASSSTTSDNKKDTSGKN